MASPSAESGAELTGAQVLASSELYLILARGSGGAQSPAVVLSEETPAGHTATAPMGTLEAETPVEPAPERQSSTDIKVKERNARLRGAFESAGAPRHLGGPPWTHPAALIPRGHSAMALLTIPYMRRWKALKAGTRRC